MIPNFDLADNMTTANIETINTNVAITPNSGTTTPSLISPFILHDAIFTF